VSVNVINPSPHFAHQRLAERNNVIQNVKDEVCTEKEIAIYKLTARVEFLSGVKRPLG
jgi:hypothetical protein